MKWRVGGRAAVWGPGVEGRVGGRMGMRNGFMGSASGSGDEEVWVALRGVVKWWGVVKGFVGEEEGSAWEVRRGVAENGGGRNGKIGSPGGVGWSGDRLDDGKWVGELWNSPLDRLAASEPYGGDESGEYASLSSL